jgi:hypothetical protein
MKLGRQDDYSTLHRYLCRFDASIGRMTTSMVTVNFDRQKKSLIAQTQTAIAPTASTASNTGPFHRIWPIGVIILGLGLNAAWVALLGYGLLSLIRLAF